MTANRTRFLLVALAAALVFPAFSAQARPGANQARAFVYGSVDKVVRVLRRVNLSKKGKRERLRRILRQRVDVAAIGRTALGIQYRRASRPEIKAFMAEFEEYLLTAYADQLIAVSGQIDKSKPARAIAQVTEIQPVGRSDMLVHSRFMRREGEPYRVGWRVRRKGNRVRIVDITLMGISQALTYRREFNRIIQDRGAGVAGLTDRLREINASVRRDSLAKAT